MKIKFGKVRSLDLKTVGFKVTVTGKYNARLVAPYWELRIQKPHGKRIMIKTYKGQMNDWR